MCFNLFSIQSITFVASYLLSMVWRVIFILTACVFVEFRGNPAHALIEVGADGIISGSIDEVSVRAHSYFFWSATSLAVGPVFQYERAHPYQSDRFYGAGIRLWNPWFLEVDAGYLSRTFRTVTGESLSGKGFGLILIPGWMPTSYFRISLPIVVKHFASGITKRWSADVIPYFGVRLEI